MTLLHQAAQKAVEALTDDIMNMRGELEDDWSQTERGCYKLGHRDARHEAVALVNDAIAALESALQQQPEPVALIGWLYDWTHSSALGKPDEQFTGFTTDEAHARKHDNPRAVYTAPALQHQEVPREPVGERISDERILHLWNTHVGDPSAKYPLSDFDKLEFARAVLRAAVLAPSTTRQQEVGSGLLDNETFRKGIREDGTVEGYFVETYYLPCKAIGDDDGFLRVVVDDNATDAETRVPHSALISSGWVRAAAPSTPENAGGVEGAEQTRKGDQQP